MRKFLPDPFVAIQDEAFPILSTSYQPMIDGDFSDEYSRLGISSCHLFLKPVAYSSVISSFMSGRTTSEVSGCAGTAYSRTRSGVS